MAVAAVVVVVVASVAVADVKAEVTAAEDAKAAAVSAKVMAAGTDVKVEIAVVVSGISLEEAVKIEVDLVLADAKAEMAATENAGLNHSTYIKRPPEIPEAFIFTAYFLVSGLVLI